MSGISKRFGFTLLELMVVMMLMGLLATIVVPTLQNLIPGYKRRQFVQTLSALVSVAGQQALIDQRTHRVFFDLTKRLVRVEIETDAKDKDGIPAFKPIDIPYVTSLYIWPENIEIKQFFIYSDEMIHRPGIKTEEVWFYIVPDALAQPVIINFIDTGDFDEGKPISKGLRLNPFTITFSEYDVFQKP